MTTQDAEADAALAQVVNGIDEMAQIATKQIQLPHHQDVARAQRLPASRQLRPIIAVAGSPVS